MTQRNGFSANVREFEYPKLIANIQLKLVFSSDIERNQLDCSQIQELKAQINDLKAENLDLKAENLDLKTKNSNLRGINQELQWHIDPHSPDGDAICNSNQ